MTSSPERTRSWTLLGAGLLGGVFACTNDYDQFQFNGGSPADGGGTTVLNGGGGNPPSNGGGGMTTTDGGGGMTTTDGGGGMTTTDGGGGSVSEGGGGSPPVGDLPCGDGPCADNEVCCVDPTAADPGTCDTACSGGDVGLECDGTSACGGQECCLTMDGGDITTVRCVGNCMDILLCDIEDDCPPQDTCMQHPDLPDGYSACL